MKTIDCTPTWSGILPMLLVTLEDGNAEGKKVIKEELRRMAQLADKYVASTKEEAEKSDAEARAAFEAGRQTIWEDLEQTTRCPKYDSYEEWIETLTAKKEDQ